MDTYLYNDSAVLVPRIEQSIANTTIHSPATNRIIRDLFRLQAVRSSVIDSMDRFSTTIPKRIPTRAFKLLSDLAAGRCE